MNLITAKTPHYSLAKSILGVDFITPEEVTKARPSIVYTDDRITALAESLPPVDALKWCKDNDQAVMPEPPTAMSMLAVRQIRPVHFRDNIGGWYIGSKFAHEDKTSLGWLATKKTPVQDSINQNWSEQNKLLSACEHVPNAAEMSWFITTYFETRGLWLFKDVYVRTSSFDLGGFRVIVGNLGAKCLSISYERDDIWNEVLGLSSGRKF
jgi:hypothetical protein